MKSLAIVLNKENRSKWLSIKPKYESAKNTKIEWKRSYSKIMKAKIHAEIFQIISKLSNEHP